MKPFLYCICDANGEPTETSTDLAALQQTALHWNGGNVDGPHKVVPCYSQVQVDQLKTEASNHAAAAETVRRERDAETKRADSVTAERDEVHALLIKALPEPSIAATLSRPVIAAGMLRDAYEGWKKAAANQNRLWSRECTRRSDAQAQCEEANKEVARLTKEIDLAQQATLKQVRENDQLKAEVERLSKGYHESCFARIEAAQARSGQLDRALTALHTGIRASYAQEFEPDDQSPVGDLIRHAFVTLADRSVRIRKLEAQLKESKANEAQTDNHGATPMVHPCPNLPPEAPTPAWFHAVANAIDRYGEANRFGKHVEDGPCLSCTAARAADHIRRLAVKLEGQ